MQAQPFQLTGVPALSRSGVDRAEMLRTDPDRLRARWLKARVVELDPHGRAPVDADGLALRPAPDVADEPPENAAFLGARGDEDVWVSFGAHVDGETVKAPGRWGILTEQIVDGDRTWVGLREHGDQLDAADAGLLTTAVALHQWRRKARFCARCGGPTSIRGAGWVSWCEACRKEEYPRTDPAVICLVHDDVGVNGEHVLLAQGARWPPWARSVLAGFVEAGESLEAAVAREIGEEVGLDVEAIRYLGSQPWPFPRSIMLGFAARANRDAELVLADGEIAAAEWYTRDDVNQGIRRGQSTLDSEPAPGELYLPGNASIARIMLESWAASAP